MKADLERERNFLFKTKNINKQPASSSSGRGGDELHNSVEGGRMHSEEANIADLVGEHLQILKKTKTKGVGRVRAESRRGKREEEDLFS
jgi:hypothetical protein